jgi:hypothetical protein
MSIGQELIASRHRVDCNIGRVLIGSGGVPTRANFDELITYSVGSESTTIEGVEMRGRGAAEVRSDR